MFGKPGAGKGTLTTRLFEKYGNKYGIEFIGTGDLLRAQVQGRTSIGRRAEGVIAAGGILDDELMLQLVSTKLEELRGKGGQNWILDGFPRTLGQASLLDPVLEKANSSLSLIINLDVPDEVILGRIADRWIHAPSGRVYNLSYNAPRIPGRDDVTGEALTKRPDDDPEIAARRLKTFYRETQPILQYYAARSITPGVPPLNVRPAPSPSNRPPPYLITLAGRTSDEIWPQLEDVVQRYFGIRADRTSVVEPSIAGPQSQLVKEVI